MEGQVTRLFTVPSFIMAKDCKQQNWEEGCLFHYVHTMEAHTVVKKECSLCIDTERSLEYIV